MKFRFNKGFSLLEVLITVAILSTGIIFVFRSFMTSLASSRFAQNIGLACYLAEDKFWEIEESDAVGAKVPESGIEELQNKNFNWHYEISDAGIADLRELKFTVSWKEKVREKEYTLDFLTYLAQKK